MPATMSNPRLLTVKEAAKELQLHPDSVRRACREGRIPSRKISGRIYIHRDVVDAPTEKEAA